MHGDVQPWKPWGQAIQFAGTTDAFHWFEDPGAYAARLAREWWMPYQNAVPWFPLLLVNLLTYKRSDRRNPRTLFQTAFSERHSIGRHQLNVNMRVNVVVHETTSPVAHNVIDTSNVFGTGARLRLVL